MHFLKWQLYKQLHPWQGKKKSENVIIDLELHEYGFGTDFNGQSHEIEKSKNKKYTNS